MLYCSITAHFSLHTHFPSSYILHSFSRSPVFLSSSILSLLLSVSCDLHIWLVPLFSPSHTQIGSVLMASKSAIMRSLEERRVKSRGGREGREGRERVEGWSPLWPTATGNLWNSSPPCLLLSLYPFTLILYHLLLLPLLCLSAIYH